MPGQPAQETRALGYPPAWTRVQLPATVQMAATVVAQVAVKVGRFCANQGVVTQQHRHARTRVCVRCRVCKIEWASRGMCVRLTINVHLGAVGLTIHVLMLPLASFHALLQLTAQMAATALRLVTATQSVVTMMLSQDSAMGLVPAQTFVLRNAPLRLCLCGCECGTMTDCETGCCADNKCKLKDSCPTPGGCTGNEGRAVGCNCDHSWQCKSQWCVKGKCTDH